MRRSSPLLLLGAALAGCLGRPSVTRVADGETREGRYIAPEAYAAYLRAELLAAEGNRRGALAELERARASDPGSPAILARAATLRCELTAPRTAAVEDAIAGFDRALDLDARFAPAWRGLSACLERQGDLERALLAAEEEARNDPRDAYATERVARLLFALGRSERAWVWLDALAAYRPHSREAMKVVLEAARRRGDGARSAEARRTLSALSGDADPSATGGRDPTLSEALAQRDRARAPVPARRQRPSELALSLLDASPELALEQATLLLRADPSDADAFVTVLVAADRLGDEDRFRAALAALDPEPLAPSSRALELLSDLLARRAGADAARALDRDGAAGADEPQRNP